jgi:hypothetical protein
MAYGGKRRELLYWSKYKEMALPPNIVDKDKVFRVSRARRLLRLNRGPLVKYNWKELGDFRAIVHIPYNTSLMSIFEQYTANIPLLFPSRTYMKELYAGHFRQGVLSEISFASIAKLPAMSAIGAPSPDPNAYTDVDGIMEWVELADFYDEDNMPYVTYFDSAEHLADLTASVDFNAISRKMGVYNVSRRARVHAAWSRVVDELQF